MLPVLFSYSFICQALYKCFFQHNYSLKVGFVVQGEYTPNSTASANLSQNTNRANFIDQKSAENHHFFKVLQIWQSSVRNIIYFRGVCFIILIKKNKKNIFNNLCFTLGKSNTITCILAAPLPTKAHSYYNFNTFQN